VAAVENVRRLWTCSELGGKQCGSLELSRVDFGRDYVEREYDVTASGRTERTDWSIWNWMRTLKFEEGTNCLFVMLRLKMAATCHRVLRRFLFIRRCLVIPIYLKAFLQEKPDIRAYISSREKLAIIIC
jgi:hypothetical protein